MSTNLPVQKVTQVLIKPVPVENLSTLDVLPAYAKPGDAGMDGKANIPQVGCLMPGDSTLVPLGISVAVPEGYELQVRPRSGLALKHQVTVLNTPGCVDSGYRGQVGAILINHGTTPFVINPGDRICQLVLSKFETIDWQIVETLPESERGEGGFGHSGVAK